MFSSDSAERLLDAAAVACAAPSGACLLWALPDALGLRGQHGCCGLQVEGLSSGGVVV